MAMANMNLNGVLVTKIWPVQALACGGGDGGGDGGGGTTKNIISPKFSNFGDIITVDKRALYDDCGSMQRICKHTYYSRQPKQ